MSVVFIAQDKSSIAQQPPYSWVKAKILALSLEIEYSAFCCTHNIQGRRHQDMASKFMQNLIING